MKLKLRLIARAIILCLLTTALLAACASQPISLTTYPKIDATPISIELTSSPSDTTLPSDIHSRTPLPTQPPATAYPLSAQAQVFAVTAGNFLTNGDKLDVDVCILIPDTQDWMIDQASLQVGGTQIPLSAGALLEYKPAASDGTPGRRCDRLSFNLPVDIDISEAILTVQSIAAPPREGQTCKFLLETVQKILDERNSGIKIACTEGPGYSDARVVRKPDTMSQAQAEQVAFSREYYSVEGPWTFSAAGIPTATPYPTVALGDAQAQPFAVMQTLNQKADAGLAFPGWVYTREDWQHDIDTENYSALLDGTPLPKYYQRETWRRLNDNGRVFQSVSLLHAADGKLLETSVFTSGTYWSSSSPERYPQQPYKLHLNEPYIGSLQANLKDGRGSAGISELDERPAIQFTLNEDSQVFNPPGHNQPILSDLVTAIFDRDSGQLRLIKTIVRLADGSQRTLEHMRLLVQGGIEPPPEVLDTLAKAQAP